MYKNPTQTGQIVILLAWNVKNKQNWTNRYYFGLERPKSRTQDKSSFFWPGTYKNPPNWTNRHSFGLERTKIPQTGQIIILFTWNVQNPPRWTNRNSFGLQRPKSPNLDKSLFFCHETSNIPQTGQIPNP
jgi:hypothetical protein